MSDFAEFVLSTTSRDVPDKVVSTAALLLLDTLGIALAAAPMEAGVIARNTAVAIYGTTDPASSARMLSDGRRVSMAGAAFAIGTQTDNLDAHDGYNPVKGHIGCAVVPALLAFSEQLPELGTRDALAAMTIGYEVAGRAGKALHASVSDYHTSGAWNALGVAAMGARLRGMNSEQLRHAVGIAEYHGPRSQVMREVANPTMLHDGSGMGALTGVSAALMAEQGFTGAPAITVEEQPSYWADLGQDWLTMDQYIKPYPICRWIHAAIDAAHHLQTAHGFTHEQIEHVEINTFHESACQFGGMPETTSQAQYSLGFAVGQILVSGHIGLSEISGAGLRNAHVARILGKTQVSATDEHNALFPSHRTADVVITLTDGQVLRSGLTHARGGREHPMSAGDITDKFLQLTLPVLGEERAQSICDAVLAMQKQDGAFATLTDLLYDPA